MRKERRGLERARQVVRRRRREVVGREAERVDRVEEELEGRNCWGGEEEEEEAVVVAFKRLRRRRGGSEVSVAGVEIVEIAGGSSLVGVRVDWRS